MEFLSDNPTYLAGGLAILALIFLVALRVTQQGKYLVRALVVLGLAAAVVVIEHFWVTDNERIEGVVYDLRKAVAASDAEGVIAHLTPDVEYVQGGLAISAEATRGFIRNELGRTKFDFVRILRLETNAGRQSGRGSAVFRVLASGSHESALVTYNFGSTNLDFALSLQETEPKVWKVDRISLTRPPGQMPTPTATGYQIPQPRRRWGGRRPGP